MEVLVYKTNINHVNDVEVVRSYLNKQTGIKKWNVDIEDVDCVLRVEVDSDISSVVENIVRKAGYKCLELE